MKKFHEVQGLKADEMYLYLTVDGQSYRIYWKDCSPRLDQAMHRQRLVVEVSPSGYGLHWPLIDKDLAITPLLQRAERAEWVIDVEASQHNVWIMPEPVGQIGIHAV
jgi:hypothetical protein